MANGVGFEVPLAPKPTAAPYTERPWGGPEVQMASRRDSAELKEPRKLLRIRPEIFGFEPEA